MHAEKEAVREYLNTTVIEVLRKGMRELVRQKPDDPHQFLANYILAHKPKN
jgi:hypothetical protein